MKIISWNLLRLVGASLDEVADLIMREQPDLLLMQEATSVMDGLPRRVGGFYSRTLQPGRIHGLAIWSRTEPSIAPRLVALPAGTMFRRLSQIVQFGDFAVANVHLSHGQMLNRRQLRRVARALPSRAAVLGDFNLIGPTLLPGFRDVGPRKATHIAGDLLPLRIDRCLVRGVGCLSAHILPRASSDHCPIAVRLSVTPRQAALAA
jgi:endonuclease/exonuclease/phosphatase family metal-dependent hydrolase